MRIHQEITKADFCFLVLGYYKDLGLGDRVTASYFLDYISAIYDLKQFFVSDGGTFATWGFLSEENEKLFLDAENTVLNPASFNSGNNLWLIDMRIPKDKCKAVINQFRRMVPAFDKFKCLRLNKDMTQSVEEITFVRRG